MQTNAGPFTVGTTPISFTNGIGNLSITNGTISSTGTQINIENTTGNVLLIGGSSTLELTSSTNSILMGANNINVNPLSANTSAVLYLGNQPGTGSSTYIGLAAPSTGTLQNNYYTLPGTFPVSSQILYCNSSGVMSWGAAGSVPWTSVTTTSQTFVPGNNYVSNNSSLVTFSLPTTSSFGDTYTILGRGAGGWKVTQNSGQNIQFGEFSTTVGTGGSLASTNQYNSITLVCTVASTTWGVTSSIGNITYV